jgi:hypothetical protein
LKRYLVMSGLASCADNDRIYGYFDDGEAARRLVNRLNSEKPGNVSENFFVMDVEQLDYSVLATLPYADFIKNGW